MDDKIVPSCVHIQVKFMTNDRKSRHFAFSLTGITVALTTEAANAKHLSFRLETVPTAKQSVFSSRTPAWGP